MTSKNVLILAVPLLGATLVVAAMSLRRSTEPEPPRKTAVTARVESPVFVAPPPPPVVKLAPEKTVARAMDDARLKTTYQNYRTALATGNRIQADALYPVLRREKDAALRIAQQDLDHAQEDFDRAVARQAVDALRR